MSEPLVGESMLAIVSAAAADELERLLPDIDSHGEHGDAECWIQFGNKVRDRIKMHRALSKIDGGGE